MTFHVLDNLTKHLAGRTRLQAYTNVDSTSPSDLTMRRLWEASELSGGDFAEEVARFYGLTRLTLPELIAAAPLTARYSPRFLREMALFPYQAADGKHRLALADPSDEAAIRAAEIVLGPGIACDVASFEDIATVLGERLTGKEPAADGTTETAAAADDIESLRDLASGAPVVRAVSDLLEKAVELRASDIHIEPMRSGLTVRMRVDGLLRLLDLPHGMIVVTGPTGSGKTTSLATMLSILNQPLRKILTIEDPVEYEISGLNQSQVKPSIGLTFATAMRAFVRQDPDVIMVGEIRDAETASIAVHAALTGHLVLTTLHTETAAAAVPRLLDLGVEGFLLRSVLRAIIAQRLVRILCDRCKKKHTLKSADLESDPRYATLGFRAGEIICEPVGCERCGGTGYRGRQGVFEVLELDRKSTRLN